MQVARTGLTKNLAKKRGFKRGAAAAALLGAGSLGACAYNEELGRSQLIVAGSQQMAQAGTAAWNDIKQKQRVSTDPRYTERLNRVAPRIIRAAGEDPAEWEYLVFEDESLNAFALPGKKFGVHTGIMDIMENDAQLAAVVGHEVAHVNYRHSAERSSQGMLAQVGLAAATIGLSTRCGNTRTAAERRSCQQSSQGVAQALGVGAMYGAILPFSRKHELEADTGGVRYMARAGYDPQEALDFWTNMAARSASRQKPPEFASTHPADETRIANLRREVDAIRSATRTSAVEADAEPTALP